MQRRMDAGAVSGPSLSEDALVDAAAAHVGGGRLRAYRVPLGDEPTVRIEIAASSGERQLVWVERSSARPVYAMAQASHPMEIAKKVHGELLLGKLGSTLVELAACWMIVLIVSGAYLAWPRQAGWVRALVPRVDLRSRPGLRNLHTAGGLWMGGLVLLFLVTGLPWTGNFGELFKRVQALTRTAGPGQEFVVTLQSSPPPKGGKRLGARSDPEASAVSLWQMHSGHHEPEPTVESSAPAAGVEPLPLSDIAARAARENLATPVEIAAPQGENGVWTVRSQTQRRPERVTIHYDRWTGEERTRIAFSDNPPLQRAVAYGIAFHEGQLFGLPNQILGAGIALSVIGLSLSGLVMWWQRRPTGALGAPPLPADRRLGYGLGALIVFFALVLPLVGASLVLVLVLESLWSRLGPRLASPGSLSSRA
jgi:uncharacterized iron-regulated membrane protein